MQGPLSSMLYGRLVHVGETFKRFADFGLRIARKLRLAVGHRSLQSVLGFFKITVSPNAHVINNKINTIQSFAAWYNHNIVTVVAQHTP